jgi:predicted RNA-binding Zn-ribbon protein involved in translation (DUF1610 family)
MNRLPPLNCNGCGGGIPLIAAPTRACIFCGEIFNIPEEYVEAAKARAQSSKARERAEPIWRALSSGISQGFLILGGVLIVFLPPIAAQFGHSFPEKQLASPQIIALYALPSLIPGAFLFTLSGALRSIGRPFKAALSAIPPLTEGDPPTCRRCGATLDIQGDPLSVSCAYCGADSIVEEISASREQVDLGKNLHSLDAALSALKRRWVWVGLGIVGAFVLIAGMSFVVAIAFFSTV